MGTLTPYITDYLGERKRRGEVVKRTARNMQYQLDSLDIDFGRRPLTQLTERALLHWLERVGHLAPSTRRNHLNTARKFCRWLVDRDAIADDPTRRIPAIRQPRSVPRTLSHTEVSALYRAVPDQRGRAIVSLMVGCGLRCVSVSRLTVADYDPEARTLEVCGKGLHRHLVYVPDETAEELDRYLASVGSFSGPLIRSNRIPSQGLSAPTISTYMSRWMDAAGVKVAPWDGRSAHALRRTAASDVYDLCRDPRAVMTMLGHADLQSLEPYVRRTSVTRLREVMEGREYRDAA